MANEYQIEIDEKFPETMNSIFEQVNKTNAPVMFNIAGKGSYVVMSQDQYAELLDEAQTVGEVDLSTDPLLSEIALEQKD